MAVGYEADQDSIENRLVKSFLRKHGTRGSIALQACFDVDPLHLDVGGPDTFAHPEIYVHLAGRIVKWMHGIGNSLFSSTEAGLAQSLSRELATSFRRMRILGMNGNYQGICEDLVIMIKRELEDIACT